MYHLCNKILCFRNKILLHWLYTAQTKHIVHKCSKNLLLRKKTYYRCTFLKQHICMCTFAPCPEFVSSIVTHILFDCKKFSCSVGSTFRFIELQPETQTRRQSESTQQTTRNMNTGIQSGSLRCKWIQPCMPKCA